MQENPASLAQRATVLDPNQYVGIVLCAGLGTRLRPLTKVIAKPVAPVGRFPVAFTIARQLLDAGLRQVHCNTHFLASHAESELRAAAAETRHGPESLRFWREEELLETGGGIARIVHDLAKEDPNVAGKTLVIVSGDIHADIPLFEMIDHWRRRSSDCVGLMCTKALDAPRKDATWVDAGQGRIKGFGADFSPADGYSARVFTTHQLLSARVVLDADVVKRSSIDLFYRAALRRGEGIMHVPWPDHAHWHDIGSYDTYMSCLRSLDQIDYADLSLPDQCLVIACAGDRVAGNAESSGPFGTAARAVSLNALSLPSGFGCLGRLRTLPCLEPGLNLAEKLRTLLPDLSHPSFLSRLATRGGDSASSFEPSDLQSSSLVLVLPASSFALPSPLLVPLELLEASSIREAFATANPYRTSRTFFLFTPG